MNRSIIFYLHVHACVCARLVSWVGLVAFNGCMYIQCVCGVIFPLYVIILLYIYVKFVCDIHVRVIYMCVWTVGHLSMNMYIQILETVNFVNLLFYSSPPHTLQCWTSTGSVAFTIQPIFWRGKRMLPLGRWRLPRATQSQRLTSSHTTTQTSPSASWRTTQNG